MDGEYVHHASPDLVPDGRTTEQQSADNVPPSRPRPRKRKGRKRRRIPVSSSMLHDGGLGPAAATSTSTPNPHLTRSRSRDPISPGDDTDPQSKHNCIEGLASNGATSSLPPEDVEIDRRRQQPGFSNPPAAEKALQMAMGNDCKDTVAKILPLAADHDALDLLHSLCLQQRASLESVLSLLAQHNQSPDTQQHFSQIAQDLHTRIDDLEVLGARILTSPPEMTSDPLLAKPSGSETGSEESPLVLQQYYNAAGWAGVVHERLIDHQYEHAHAISERRRDGALLDLFETESEKEYCREEDDLKKQLKDARRQALDILKRCEEQGHSPKYPPRSSLFHSVPSSVSRGPDSRDISPLARLRSRVDLLSSDPVRPIDADAYPLPTLIGTGMSRIKQWVSNVLMSGPGGAYDPYDNTADEVSTTSAVSLPEYIRIDKRAAPLPPGDFDVSDRVLQRDPIPRSHVVLARTRSFSSMRSPTFDPPHTGFRRQTVPVTKIAPPEMGS